MDIEPWPYKWFGVWKEYGDAYKNYPSIKDFVNEEENKKYDIGRLVKYLNSGIAVVATSRMHFPSPFTGKITGGSISFRTDGEWVWFDDLAEYVEQHNLAIPRNWYDYIKKNDFIVPSFDMNDLDKLEMPSL